MRHEEECLALDRAQNKAVKRNKTKQHQKTPPPKQQKTQQIGNIESIAGYL